MHAFIWDSIFSFKWLEFIFSNAWLFQVVEGDFSNESNRSVHNTQAAVMLVYWLPDIQSHDLQIWLSERLMCLCSHGYHNRMNCCNEKMIGAILSVLSRERQINPKAVGEYIIRKFTEILNESLYKIFFEVTCDLSTLSVSKMKLTLQSCCSGIFVTFCIQRNKLIFDKHHLL